MAIGLALHKPLYSRRAITCTRDALLCMHSGVHLNKSKVKARDYFRAERGERERKERQKVGFGLRLLSTKVVTLETTFLVHRKFLAFPFSEHFRSFGL